MIKLVVSITKRKLKEKVIKVYILGGKSDEGMFLKWLRYLGHGRAPKRSCTKVFWVCSEMFPEFWMLPRWPGPGRRTWTRWHQRRTPGWTRPRGCPRLRPDPRKAPRTAPVPPAGVCAPCQSQSVSLMDISLSRSEASEHRSEHENSLRRAQHQPKKWWTFLFGSFSARCVSRLCQLSCRVRSLFGSLFKRPPLSWPSPLQDAPLDERLLMTSERTACYLYLELTTLVNLFAFMQRKALFLSFNQIQTHIWNCFKCVI